MSTNHMTRNSIALVTGASSGIGRATASLLAEKGIRVALTARRVERLEALAAEIDAAGGAALVLPADIREPGACEGLIAQINQTWGPVDILVNNAGFGWGSPLAKMEWETAQAMLDVNVTALVHLTWLVLPGMLKRGQGWVVNIASIAGDIPAPPLTLYSATKSLVQAFSESLYREVGRQGVHVGVVNPGPIATEFGAVAYGWSLERAHRHGASPEAVARAVWRVIAHRRKWVYVPWYFRGVRWFNLLGEWLVDRGIGIFLKVRGSKRAREK